jgi:hypothetical protein
MPGAAESIRKSLSLALIQLAAKRVKPRLHPSQLDPQIFLTAKPKKSKSLFNIRENPGREFAYANSLAARRKGL